MNLSFRETGSPNWVRVWGGLLVLWAIFAVLGTWLNYQFLALRGRPISWPQSIRMNVAEYGVWALVLTPLILLVCAKLPSTRKNLSRLAVGHLFGLSGIVCLDVTIKTLLGREVYPNLPALSFIPQFRQILFQETEPDIQIYLVVAVMAYVVAYYVDLRNQERHTAGLQNSLVRAELQVLKMQLQPHFLFNTLHSVASLIPANPRAAQKMICSLGDLLRMSLAAEDLPQVTLARELEFLEIYLDIQRVRFQDRLVVEMNIAEEVVNAKVPYLILQPLVENSIKHGIARRPGAGKVKIDARKGVDDLCITIVNDNADGNGLSGVVPEQDSFGVGLENTKSRLRLLYGDGGQLSTQELSDGRFQVVVRLPFQCGSISNGATRLVSAADPAPTIRKIEGKHASNYR